MNQDPHRDAPISHAGAPLSEAVGAVVLLHGRGGSARDILSVGGALDTPQLAYLAPEASGNTWYPYSFLAPIEENEPWLSFALSKVKSTVQVALEAGIAAERIVICGFSQGACLSTEFVARNPQRYAGLIAFTGGLVGPEGWDLAHPGDLAGTPAFFGSGDPDPHVPWSRVQESADILAGMGAVVTARRYPGRPHTVSADELDYAKQFVRATFAL